MYGHKDSRPKVPCRLCDAPTPMLGTKLCDYCWELESRVQANPNLARKILAALDAAEKERQC